jgi:Cu2+-exporting ATPase
LREVAPARPDQLDADTVSVAYDDPAFQSTFVRTNPDGTREARLMLEGVRCAACVWLIEQTLQRLAGVVSVEVNYVTRRAQLRWDPEQLQFSAVLTRVRAIGYGAHPYQADRAETLRKAEQRQWLWRLFVAGFGMMQVMMYAVPVYLAGDGTMTADVEQMMRWASLLLTVPVVGYSAQPFFRGAWREWRMRRFGMDFPVALGIAVGFGASCWATITAGGQVYFDSITMFIFALLFGRYLELLARVRVGDSLNYLARLVPAAGERLNDYPHSRATERIAVVHFSAGDYALVKPGEPIPADGVVVEGHSDVNESLLTGESEAVRKVAGSRLVGGSINMSSPLVMHIERVGAATMLSSIVRLVERAAAERQPLAEMADRYAHRFIVLVLVVAVMTVIGWSFIDPSRALWIAVAVLVATCPCALSLATPVALTAATGELARRGFVATRGHVIEVLARATDFVFDKTGTLTEGEPRVIDVHLYGNVSAVRAIAVAAALEGGSEHPVARAIARYAIEADCETLAVETQINTPGEGMEGVVQGERYRLGRQRFAAQLCPANVFESTQSVYTEAWLCDARGPIARFTLGDRIKPQARELITALRAAGKRVHLLSGDGRGPVQEAAQSLGIEIARAEATPEDKGAYVHALQRDGAVVAMIGDGINDAPVLAQADVSVAMASGAVLAQTHADAVLLSGEPADLLRALTLSQRTKRIIRQNLAWGFGYNFLVIPAAVAGLVSPWLAGVGMSASSLLVIANALRLRRARSEN